MSQLNDPYERLEQMRGMFENTQSQVQSMQESIAALSVEAEDEDGRLKATVGSTGVTGLYIDPRAMRLGSEELAERLTTLIQKATGEMQVEIQRLSDELLAGIRPPGLPTDADLGL